MYVYGCRRRTRHHKDHHHRHKHRDKDQKDQQRPQRPRSQSHAASPSMLHTTAAATTSSPHQHGHYSDKCVSNRLQPINNCCANRLNKVLLAAKPPSTLLRHHGWAGLPLQPALVHVQRLRRRPAATAANQWRRQRWGALPARRRSREFGGLVHHVAKHGHAVLGSRVAEWRG